MNTSNNTPQWLAEFGPDYAVPDSLALCVQFSDVSWGNDASPSFMSKDLVKRGEKVFRSFIWVEHPDEAKREIPGKRFRVSLAEMDAKETEQLSGESFDVMETDDVTEAISEALSAVQNNPLNPEILAKAFSAVLFGWLTPEQRATVLERNKAEGNPSICHSHDFCDANMAMVEAFQNLGVGEIDSQDDEQTALWDAAWALAKSSGFWFGKAVVS